MSTNIVFNQHVPEIKVSQFLQAIRSKYALAYLFNSSTKTISIVKLSDVITNPAYLEWTSKADSSYSDDPVDFNGYTLEEILEDDELNKTLSTAWSSYKISGGREKIDTAASTLHMSREQDVAKPARQWLIPVTSQKGNSVAYNTGENKFSLRLLKYYGLQKDSQNNDYTLGSAISENYAGAALPGNHL